MRALCTTLQILLLIAPHLARGQQAAAPPADARARIPGDVKMDFKEAPIELVIETVAKLTGKSFIYDDRVRGNVTVIAGPDVTVEEAYKIFESILQVKGFTTVPAPGGMLKIIPIREAKESPIDTVDGARGSTPDRDLFITRLIPLKFVKAETVNNTLKPLVSKDANVIAYAPTNTLILTDTASNIRRLMRIIEEIDVEIYSETIKVFPLKYAEAAQLATQLGEIFGEETAPGPPGAPRVRPRVRPAGVEGATDGVVGSVGEPRFIVDERTNALIAIATRSALEQIENLIEMLDYQRKGTGKIHVYRLQNADAEEMADTLSSLGQGGGSRPRTTTQRPTTPGAGAVPGAPSGGGGGVTADLGDGVRVTADPPTNSLIIQATPETFSTLSEVIQALDTRRPQVLVEALIMEVDVDDAKDLGMGWLYNATYGADDDRRLILGQGDGQVSPNDFGGTGLATAVIGKLIDVPDPSDTDPSDGIDRISVPVIQGLMTASETDSDINIVSAPVVLTADNEEAEIIVGDNIPVPTSQVSTPSGQNVSPNQNGFDTSVNISRQDVGVTLRVTPQISEGDTVRLQIFQELSEVQEGTLDSPQGPVTTNRKVENTVYVRDSEAVIIGGILSETQGNSEDKVPWLGDIPILGWLFKTTGESVRKTNLMVILTPHIVRSPTDLNRFTVERRERFRDAAREGLDYSEDELEARKRALEAGLELPKDPNPVRRELDRHSNRYPTEALPGLRAEQKERETQRQKEMEELRAAERAGAYVVQVSFLGDAHEAAHELRRLIQSGYDGTLLSQTEMGKVVHYVQLGPYTDEVKAQHVARELRANLDLQAVVLVEP
jgi:general secretion pathway protein D